MEEKDLKKSIDLLNNNLTKTIQQQNEHLKSIKTTLNIILFFFLVMVVINIATQTKMGLHFNLIIIFNTNL